MSPFPARTIHLDADARAVRPSEGGRAPGVAPAHARLLHLQAGAGNRAVTALLSRRGPALQRAIGDDFLVRGIFPDADKPGNESKIFFDFAKSEIPDQEKPKLDTLAIPFERDLVLHGFVSEEGSAAGNAPVAKARIGKVSEELRARGHFGEREPVPHLTESEGVVDYRSRRFVEVEPLGTSPSTSCDSNPDCEAIFQSAIGAAKTNVLNAAIALSADTDDARAALQAAFHSTSDTTKSAVDSGLSNILGQLDIMEKPTNHVCKDSCEEPKCAAGTAAFTPNGEGPAAVTTLCPDFGRTPLIAPPDLLVHEAAHGATGLAANETAHAESRLFKHLLPEATVKNADSYMLFVRLLTTGERGPSEPEEQFAPDFTDDEKSDTDKTVAWLGNVLNKASFSMQAVYGRIFKNRTGQTVNDDEDINNDANQELRRFKRALVVAGLLDLARRAVAHDWRNRPE
jgi:hypothetical protein